MAMLPNTSSANTAQLPRAPYAVVFGGLAILAPFLSSIIDNLARSGLPSGRFNEAFPDWFLPLWVAVGVPAISLLPVVYACRGRNWGRVVLVAFAAIDFAFLALGLLVDAGSVPGERIASATAESIGAFALLLPSSSAWFRLRGQAQAAVSPPENARPRVLTVTAVVLFAAGVSLPPMAFSDLARNTGAWYLPYLCVSAAVVIFSGAGVWRLRRWGAFAYIGYVVLDVAVNVAAGTFVPGRLFVPGIVIAVLLGNLNRMR